MFISLYHVNAEFFLILLLPLWVRVFKQMAIKRGKFQYHWNSLLVLAYVFCFIVFTHVFVPFTSFPNRRAPTLVSGILVKAGLRQGNGRIECYSHLPLIEQGLQSVENRAKEVSHS